MEVIEKDAGYFLNLHFFNTSSTLTPADLALCTEGARIRYGPSPRPSSPAVAWGTAVRSLCSSFPLLQQQIPRASSRNIVKSKRLLASSLPFNKTTGDKTYLIPTGKICTVNWLDRAGTRLTLTSETLSTLLKTGWGSWARQAESERLLGSVYFSHLQIKMNFSTPCESPGSLTHKWKEVSFFPLLVFSLYILFSAFRVSVLYFQKIHLVILL